MTATEATDGCWLMRFSSATELTHLGILVAQHFGATGLMETYDFGHACLSTHRSGRLASVLDDWTVCPWLAGCFASDDSRFSFDDSAIVALPCMNAVLLMSLLDAYPWQD